MSVLARRLGKLEHQKQSGFVLLLLDVCEGESEDEAKKRISAGVNSYKTIIWISEVDANL